MFVAVPSVSSLAVALLRALAFALVTASSFPKCFSATLSKSFWTILMSVKSGAMGRRSSAISERYQKCAQGMKQVHKGMKIKI